MIEVLEDGRIPIVMVEKFSGMMTKDNDDKLMVDNDKGIFIFNFQQLFFL